MIVAVRLFYKETNIGLYTRIIDLGINTYLLRKAISLSISDNLLFARKKNFPTQPASNEHLKTHGLKTF